MLMDVTTTLDEIVEPCCYLVVELMYSQWTYVVLQTNSLETLLWCVEVLWDIVACLMLIGIPPKYPVQVNLRDETTQKKENLFADTHFI